jgi:hypothetical protein
MIQQACSVVGGIPNPNYPNSEENTSMQILKYIVIVYIEQYRQMR